MGDSNAGTLFGRELEVYRLTHQGLNTAEIGDRLKISASTVYRIQNALLARGIPMPVKRYNLVQVYTPQPDGSFTVPVGSAHVAYVDARDLSRVKEFRWGPVKSAAGVIYAGAHDDAGRRIYMHSLVLGLVPGLDVDHADRDGLNNRRSNLRRATRSQNLHNMKAREGGASRFKGVRRAPGRFAWVAKISVRGTIRHLGTFKSEEAAARAYDAEARRYYGEFARTNEDLGLYEVK